METFIIAFVHRVLSGAQSYFGYSKKNKMLWIFAIILTLFTFTAFCNHLLFYVYFLVNLIVVVMKSSSFDRSVLKKIDKYKDIHLWESLLTGGFVIYLTLTGYNIIMICLSVYPAMILHKGLINLGSGLSFFASATDDPTGKTYSIPLLGIKVPRLGTNYRLIFAIVSLILAILVVIFKLNLFFAPTLPFLHFK